MIFYYVLGVLGVIFDFITKKAAVKYLKDGTEKILIDKVFRLSYVENTGAAFGILSNQRYVFIIMTVIIVALLIWWLNKNRTKNVILNLGTTLVISGAAGNFIDRVFLGYVVDFLDFYLINFPVFNFADCFVCVGAFLLVLYYMFFDKNDNTKMKDNFEKEECNE